MEAVLSQNAIDHAADELRLILEDGPEAINLLEPMDCTVRSHLLTVTLAFLMQFEKDDKASPSDRWLKSLPREAGDRGSNEFIGQGARVCIRKDLDGNWWAQVGNKEGNLAAFVKVNTRRAVRALLAGLQII